MRELFDRAHTGENPYTRATYATKTSLAETSHKWRVFRVWNENENFWDKYLKGPIQERTLTRATYATKPSVAETSQKWRVLRVWNENENLWGNYLIRPI